MNIESPILITGCARSGTSLIAGIFNLCGAWGGKFVSPGVNNQKGFFENAAIRNKICKPFLEKINADPKGQNPLPDKIQLENYIKDALFPIIWEDKVLEILKEQGYKDETWFYKGAKICLIWQIWAEAFPNAKWIIVRREKEDIIDSCLRAKFMSAFQNRQGWAHWVDFHLERFKEIQKYCKNVYEIYPQKIINGDFTDIKKIIVDFNLKWNEEKIAEFVTPILWNNNIL